LVEARRLLGMLRREGEGEELQPQPGLDRLGELIGQVSRAGLPVELTTEGEPIALPPGIDLCAYRIVQEALTNSLKHAGPARASVAVRYAPRTLELEVRDTGAGAPPNGDGHGLIGMRERVAPTAASSKQGRPRAASRSARGCRCHEPARPDRRRPGARRAASATARVGRRACSARPATAPGGRANGAQSPTSC
jgi:nitrate/nitrite-specific signal transduction histidine kinase